MVKHRINKYFKYGFAIVFPPNAREWTAPNYSNSYNHPNSHYRGSNENIGPLSFKVRRMIDNVIYINHDSNIEKMLERNEELEKKCLDEGKALYMSSLFCSFVSILRYVKINGIDYRFPQDLDQDLLDQDLSKLFDSNEFLSKTNKVKLQFIDRYGTVYGDAGWYDDFHKSVLLNNY
jgi:hypothetical protein